MDLILKFKNKVRNAESICLADYRECVDGAIFYMEDNQIRNAKKHVAFFEDLYDHCLLKELLINARMDQKVSRHYAVLFAYYHHKTELMVAKHPLQYLDQSASKKAKFLHLSCELLPLDSILQDEDLLYLCQHLVKDNRYKYGREIFTVNEEIFKIAAQKIKTHFFANNQDESIWIDTDLQLFREQFCRFDKAFDVANLFYVALAEASRNSAFSDDEKELHELHVDFYQKHVQIVDPTGFYSQFWGDVFNASREVSNWIGNVAMNAYLDGSLALYRHRSCDDNSGMSATMMRLFEHEHVLSSLHSACDELQKQKLRMLQHGAAFDSREAVNALQRTFSMCVMLERWCHMTDAASGRIGEGATRLRSALYAANGQLPIANLDPSLFYALDRIRPSVVCCDFERLQQSTFLRLGLGMGLCVYLGFSEALMPPLPNCRQYSFDESTLTMQILSNFLPSGSYFAYLLRCLYEQCGCEFAPCEQRDMSQILKGLCIKEKLDCYRVARLLAELRRQSCPEKIVPALEGSFRDGKPSVQTIYDISLSFDSKAQVSNFNITFDEMLAKERKNASTSTNK